MKALRLSQKRTLSLMFAMGALLVGFQNCAKPMNAVNDPQIELPIQPISSKPSITGEFIVTRWEGNLCAESSAAICTMTYAYADLSSSSYRLTISDDGLFSISVAGSAAVLSGVLSTTELSAEQKNLYGFLDDSAEGLSVLIQQNANALNGLEAVVAHAKYLTRDANTGEIVLHTTHGNHLTLQRDSLASTN